MKKLIISTVCLVFAGLVTVNADASVAFRSSHSDSTTKFSNPTVVGEAQNTRYGAFWGFISTHPFSDVMRNLQTSDRIITVKGRNPQTGEPIKIKARSLTDSEIKKMKIKRKRQRTRTKGSTSRDHRR